MLTSAQRREILNTEYRNAVANLKPNCSVDGGKPWYSRSQLNAAKGIARRNALKIIDARCAR